MDGRSTLVTRAFYDDRAPRRVTLDAGAAAAIERGRNIAVATAVLYAILVVTVPWLLLWLVPLLDRRVRTAIRTRTTRWLDRHDAGTTVG